MYLNNRNFRKSEKHRLSLSTAVTQNTCQHQMSTLSPAKTSKGDGKQSILDEEIANHLKEKKIQKNLFKMFSLCRLCARCKDDTELTVPISEIQSKLSLFCGWKPSESEAQMPPKACTVCVDELDRSLDFFQTISAGEEQLLKLISEQKEAESNDLVPQVEEIMLDVIKLEPEAVDEICTQEHGNSHENVAMNGPDQVSEKEHSIKALQNETTTDISTKKVPNCSSSERFLKELNDDDCLADGTITAAGVAKLEKIIPSIKTISWSSCQFECKRCDQMFEGATKFFAHNHSIHFENVSRMEFSCFYCDYKHRREYILNRHIAKAHFGHLKYR